MRIRRTGLTQIVFTQAAAAEISALVDLEVVGPFKLDGKQYLYGFVNTRHYKRISRLVV